MSDTTGNVIFYVLLLVLPLSALFARRMPLGRVAVMALAWIGIFATGLVVVAIVNQNQWLISGTRALFYGPDQSVVGSEVRIPMADDGHFWARATINGVECVMLVDSGATVTALSMTTAAAAKIDLDGMAPPAVVSTANGTVTGKSASIASLKVGGITATDLPTIVAPEFGDQDVLGMNFLSRLKSWRVEGKTLILTPNPK
ncbi:retropepsin-like aspartic protease family protein [Sphingomonas asaccharolytica]|uniref:retropepsin-like aspartic protease family protein n=1 Tax=Sphingomonas asaccharolytica TaxID=40681 RepID=UPI00082C3DFD|nr:TIGR02281 family clan AA aspartic protease [Sphingomonas asaccharolytica]